MKLNYSEILNVAWGHIKNDLPLVAALTLVSMTGLAVCNSLAPLGNLLSFPFLAGYLRCLLKIRNRETIGYSDFFWGFLNFNRLLHLGLANLLVGLGFIFGLIFLLFPGIWWLIASSFALQLMVLKDLDSVGAIQKSLALVKNRWWNVFGFTLLIAMINIVGTLCFFVGVLISIPVSAMAALGAVEFLMKESGSLGSPDPSSSSSPAPAAGSASQV